MHRHGLRVKLCPRHLCCGQGRSRETEESAGFSAPRTRRTTVNAVQSPIPGLAAGAGASDAFFASSKAIFACRRRHLLGASSGRAGPYLSSKQAQTKSAARRRVRSVSVRGATETDAPRREARGTGPRCASANPAASQPHQELFPRGRPPRSVSAPVAPSPSMPAGLFARQPSTVSTPAPSESARAHQAGKPATGPASGAAVLSRGRPSPGEAPRLESTGHGAEPRRYIILHTHQKQGRGVGGRHQECASPVRRAIGFWEVGKESLKAGRIQPASHGQIRLSVTCPILASRRCAWCGPE